jgi:membrane-associated phospholipid phosphatase
VQPAAGKDPKPRPAFRLPVLPTLVGAYLAAVTLFMVFVLHISVSPERLLLLMLIAALVLGRARLFLADWIPFLVLFLSYEYLRGLGSAVGMPVHDVTELERVVDFGQIPTILLQQAFHHVGQVSWYDIAATTFYFLHFAFPLAVGYIFWLQNRTYFRSYSWTLIGMSFAAFIFYMLVPVAPPWLALPDSVAKIIDHTLPSYTDLPGIPVPVSIYHWMNPNKVAAMPSLHAAYPLLAFMFAWRLFGRRSWPLLLYTILVWVSIVYLGEHYVVDIIGGVILTVGAYYAEELITRWRARRASPQGEPRFRA